MLLARTAIAVFALSLTVSAKAQVIPYEWVQQSGPNNVIDSNASSCDPSQGCYTLTGGLCSANPGVICDLQIVPKGRCTYGSLAANGGPGGTNTCVWPHGAGRCASNTHVGCLTDAYVMDPNNVFTGSSVMCLGTGNPTCDMGTDPYGGPFRTACACSSTVGSPNFETGVCGLPSPVCSDGDPQRQRGGYGLAFGSELNLGAGGVRFEQLGPAVNGSLFPSTSPRYPIESPPALVQPQRDAGSIERGETGPIQTLRTTEALEQTVFSAGLQVDKLRGLGDSFWSDWSFEPQAVTGSFTTHAAILKCPAQVGWNAGIKVDPTPASPDSGDENYCSLLSRDSLTFVWHRDLTTAEQAANPACPPTCRKDFDFTTVELEAIRAVDALDHNAGVQLALQNGEGRLAGGGDSVGAMSLSLVSILVGADARCRLGGWGNSPGYVGRCSDGVGACIPGDPNLGDTLCAGQGNQCRPCGGPYDPLNADLGNGLPNNLALPPGYNTHGQADLDLVSGHRIGLITGASILAQRRLNLVSTSGYSGAEFRDLPGLFGGSLDLADLGPVDSSGPPFGPGIGTGGTFANGSPLPVGATCCANGASISWPAAQPGAVEPGKAFTRSFDAGPGPDGIPACIGDNARQTNGLDACNQRLGLGAAGPKTDGAFNSGLDDVAMTFPVGSSGTIPASSARFGASWDAGVPAIPRFNQVATAAYRDFDVIGTLNDDGLVKLNVSYCPIVSGQASCTTVDCDDDGDGVLCGFDNCPDDVNSSQSDMDGDGVGDACDNCTAIANPRVAPSFLALNGWATLTGGQRDDDHDGYGNKCDADFTPTGALVGSGDLTQFRASAAKSRAGDTCGTSGLMPCAIFNLSEVGGLIGSADLAQFRLLSGKVAGPKCATCPKPCTHGTAGSCF